MLLLLTLACTDDEPPETPFVPTGRAGSAGYVDADGVLQLAGGRTAAGATDDTLAFDPETGTWTAGPPSGEAFYRGVAHAGGPGGVVFGGTTGFNEETPHTWLWEPGADIPWVPASEEPQGRAWHASAWGDGQLWIHGGRQDDGDVVIFDDLWSYDPGADVWTGHALPTGGPGGLYRHGLAWLEDDLWVFGGLDEDDERNQALWRLDRAAGQWIQQELGLPAPSPRASHRLLSLDDRLWLWGGDDDDDSVWVRAASDQDWTEVEDLDDLGPRVREDPVIAPLPDGSGALLFGGDLAGTGAVNDVWRWDVATEAWTELAPVDLGF